MVLGRSTVLLGRSTMVLGRSTMGAGTNERPGIDHVALKKTPPDGADRQTDTRAHLVGATYPKLRRPN